jgi:hypothetical protein
VAEIDEASLYGKDKPNESSTESPVTTARRIAGRSILMEQRSSLKEHQNLQHTDSLSSDPSDTSNQPVEKHQIIDVRPNSSNSNNNNNNTNTHNDALYSCETNTNGQMPLRKTSSKKRPSRTRKQPVIPLVANSDANSIKNKLLLKFASKQHSLTSSDDETNLSGDELQSLKDKQFRLDDTG